MYDNKALKSSYDKYVKIKLAEINKTNNQFYINMADSVYQAAIKALDPSIDHMHIIPAQTGSGKSTFMEAMVASLYENGFTCAIVANTINQCHKFYYAITKLVNQPTGREFNKTMLKALKGGRTPILKVAIYTSIHKASSKLDSSTHGIKSEEIERYSRFDKVRAPIVIATHNALLREIEEGLDTGIQKFHGDPRNVIFLDESPEFNTALTVKKGDIELIKDELTAPKYKKHYKAITKLQNRFEKSIKTLEGKTGQYHLDLDLFRDKLGDLFLDRNDTYFETELNLEDRHLSEIFDKRGKREQYDKFIKLIKWLKDGNVIYSKNHKALILSKNNFINNPAFILLDATAEVEKFQENFRLPVASVINPPDVSYERTQIKYIIPPKRFTGANTSFKDSASINKYIDYVLSLITKTTSKGDKLILVVKKHIADALYKRFMVDPYNSYTYEERTINILYWGNFIGANKWKKIKKVFLITGYQRPKDIYIGLDSSYKGSISEEDLKKQEGSSLVGDALTLKESESLKWFKQLAARGNIRNIDKDGKAEEMEIFTDTDLIWLLQNQQVAFPGSPTLELISGSLGSVKDKGLKIILTLLKTQKPYFTLEELSKKGGYTNSNQISRVLDGKLKEAIKAIGWEFMPPSKVKGYTGDARKLLVNTN